MTLPLPPVQADQSVQFALDRIAQQFPVQIQNLGTGIFLQLASTGTARNVAFGVSNASLSATSAVTLTVTHGMGLTPVFVHGGGSDNGSTAVDVYLKTSSITSTQFQFTVAVRGGGSVSTTVPIHWLAIA